ncbi:MAG: hypothetical protein L3J45_07995 [Flavobacteriaceae bacterium]|nr:hypothetical protein [Flavobacteriaceae bacterium]
MKKTLFIAIFLGLILTSCVTSTYIFKFSTTPGIDFRKGKWLLNEIESPYIIRPQLTEIVKKEFSKYLKGNLYTLNKTKGLMLPPRIPLNPSKQILKEIKAGTRFDYFINIKTKILNDDVGSITFGTADDDNQVFNDDSDDYSNGDESKVRVTLEVYDLNNFNVIYSQTVIGITQLDYDSKGMTFAKDSYSLIITALHKIIKKIEKNHI